MKRNILFCALVIVMALASTSVAADLAGFYVAPKILWSNQIHENAVEQNDGWLTGWTPYPTNGRSGDSWGGALALGYNFNAKLGLPLRAEIEYAMRTQSKVNFHSVKETAPSDFIDIKRKMDVSTIFTNFYYDISTGTAFTPYVGAGLGLALISVNDNFNENFSSAKASTSRSIANFAWNVGAGVSYAIDASWAADLGYRYCDFGTVKSNMTVYSSGNFGTQKSDVTAHEVLLGVRYTF